MTSPEHVQTVHHTFSRILGWLGVVMGLVLFGTGLSEGGVAPVACIGIAMACLSYCVLVQPRLRIDARGLTARNVLHDVHLPWSSIARAQATGNLVVDDVEGNRTTVWGVSLQRPGTATFFKAGLRARQSIHTLGASEAFDPPAVHQDDDLRLVEGSYTGTDIPTAALPDVINSECAGNDATVSERTATLLPLPCVLVAIAVIALVAAVIV